MPPNIFIQTDHNADITRANKILDSNFQHKSNVNKQNHELAPGHHLVVRRAEDPLPGDFGSLWPAAVSAAGGATPVSYARMDRANIISLAVTEVQKKRAQLPTKWSDSAGHPSNRIHDEGEEDMAQKTVLIPSEVVERAIDAQAEGKEDRFSLDLSRKCS